MTSWREGILHFAAILTLCSLLPTYALRASCARRLSTMTTTKGSITFVTGNKKKCVNPSLSPH